MSRQQLNLKKFDMKNIPDDSVCVFIGKRRSGKSVLLQDLLYYKRDIPYGICISPTERINPFFQNFIPLTYIYDEYDDRIIDNVLQRQGDIRKRIAIERGFSADPRLCLVMDDCLAANDWKKSVMIRSLFMNGRHYKILYCLTMQYVMGIPPDLRSNVDYTFIMKDSSNYNRERLFKNYAGAAFPNLNVFHQVMDQVNKHECLVIDNNADSNKVEDQVYWYKADIHEKFNFGCENYWNYHYDNYNDSEETTFDTTPYRSGRNKGIINVNKKDQD